MKRDIGVNLWVWDSPVTTSVIIERSSAVRQWGFDTLELPIENATDWDGPIVRDVLHDNGLGATACAVLGPGRELCEAPATVIRATQDYLRAAIDLCAEVDAPVLGGPIYASVGRTWRVDANQRRWSLEEVRDNLVPVIEHARGAGVMLAIEPLNRYETSLITTVAQARELIDPLPSEVCGILFDTFHANIEESDVAQAIIEAGERLAHVQASASHRGAPGDDHIDWNAVAWALDHIGYSRSVCIESFTAHNAMIATAASIWRPLAPTQDEIATLGLRTLREAGV